MSSFSVFLNTLNDLLLLSAGLTIDSGASNWKLRRRILLVKSSLSLFLRLNKRVHEYPLIKVSLLLSPHYAVSFSFCAQWCFAVIEIPFWNDVGFLINVPILKRCDFTLTLECTLPTHYEARREHSRTFSAKDVSCWLEFLCKTQNFFLWGKKNL